MKISERIENLKIPKGKTFAAVKEITEWWSKNVDVIGRDIGIYQLVSLRYDNAYSGCYSDYILSGEEEDGSRVIYGHGYTGHHSGNDYNTFSVRCANRLQHIAFLQTFQSEMEKHLTAIENQVFICLFNNTQEKKSRI